MYVYTCHWSIKNVGWVGWLVYGGFNRVTFSFFKSNQTKSFLLAYEAVKITINSQVGWRGYMGRVIGVRFLRGSMCAEGMGSERRWIRWVLQGTWTAIRHPGVS